MATRALTLRVCLKKRNFFWGGANFFFLPDCPLIRSNTVHVIDVSKFVEHNIYVKKYLISKKFLFSFVYFCEGLDIPQK